MANVWLILSREVRVRVRKKSFIIVTLLAPLLFVLMSALPSLLMLMDSGQEYTIGVVDEEGLVAPALTEVKEGGISYRALTDTVGLRSGALLRETGFEGILHVQPNAAQSGSGFTLYSLKPITMDIQHDIEGRAKALVREIRMARYDIEGLDSIMDDIRSVSVRVEGVIIGEKGKAMRSSSEISYGVAIALVVLLSVLLPTSSGMVMTGVIEEKNSRVVEILASSVRMTDLMIGKILGIGLVFILQILLWAIFTLILGALGLAIIGQMAPELLGSPDSLAAMPMVPGQETIIASVGEHTSRGELGDFLQLLRGVPWGMLLGSFFFYFIFGYLAYAAMYAAAGSAVEEQQDASQLTIPLSVPLFLGIFIAFYVAKAPHSALAIWASIIPFTSPVVMPVRCAFAVPLWQLLLSGALLILFFWGVSILAARVYRQGVLRYGGKYSWRDIARWVRQEGRRGRL